VSLDLRLEWLHPAFEGHYLTDAVFMSVAGVINNTGSRGFYWNGSTGLIYLLIHCFRSSLAKEPQVECHDALLAISKNQLRHDTSHVGIEHRERKAKVRVPGEVVIMDQAIRVRPGAVLRDSTRAAEDGEKLYCTIQSLSYAQPQW
jgi:hypothetical protein